MAYCYDGKTYETIKEMAEEYGIDRQRMEDPAATDIV